MSIRRDADKWAEIAHERISNKLRKEKIYDTYALINSLKVEVSEQNNGNTFRGRITYNAYGIYPHLGVGKGVTGTDIAKLTGSKRKPKRWTKAVALEKNRFYEIMRDSFLKHNQVDIIKILVESLPLNF